MAAVANGVGLSCVGAAAPAMLSDKIELFNAAVSAARAIKELPDDQKISKENSIQLLIQKNLLCDGEEIQTIAHFQAIGKLIDCIAEENGVSYERHPKIDESVISPDCPVIDIAKKHVAEFNVNWNLNSLLAAYTASIDIPESFHKILSDEDRRIKSLTEVVIENFEKLLNMLNDSSRITPELEKQSLLFDETWQTMVFLTKGPIERIASDYRKFLQEQTEKSVRVAAESLKVLFEGASDEKGAITNISQLPGMAKIGRLTFEVALGGSGRETFPNMDNISERALRSVRSLVEGAQIEGLNSFDSIVFGSDEPKQPSMD